MDEDHKSITKRWWIAKNKNGNVFLHPSKPFKIEEKGCWENSTKLVEYPFCLPPEILNLEWNDEQPAELILIIK